MMDRRQFAKLIAAAVAGVRVADELLSTAPTLPGNWQYLGNATDGYHATPWPPSPITDEQIEDAGGYLMPQEFEMDLRLYGNAYMRRDGSRVSPLQAVREMRRRHA